jgi:hypothetical protein
MSSTEWLVDVLHDIQGTAAISAATLFDIECSPKLFSQAGYFLVTRRCFDEYGL